MTTPDNVLEVEWHHSISYAQVTNPFGSTESVPDGGRWKAVSEEGRLWVYRHPYSVLMDSTERLLDEVESQVCTTALYRTLAEDADISWGGMKVQDAFMKLASPVLRVLMFAYVDGKPLSTAEATFQKKVQTSLWVLFGSAVRRAKASPNQAQVFTAAEWAQAAQEDRNRNPNPDHDDKYFDNMYEEATGIREPEEQKLFLGRVASQVLNIPVLQLPRRISWHDQIATLLARPTRD